MTTWFTSDTHYFHKNIVTYSVRPFHKVDGQPDLEGMHRTFIQNWNDRVRPRDTVIHLGDFAFGPVSQIAQVRKKLEGRIILIRGNHDRKREDMLAAGFEEVYNNLEMELDGYKLWLNHIPVGTGEEARRLYKPEFKAKPPPFYHYFLCGHVHQYWRRKGKIINVGVDVWDYKPVTLEELIAAV